jgi:hypothetical protein
MYAVIAPSLQLIKAEDSAISVNPAHRMMDLVRILRIVDFQIIIHALSLKIPVLIPLPP